LKKRRDLYEVLGIKRTAGYEEVKKAYRLKVLEAHPDTGGDAEAFREIQAAYDVLSDLVQRQAYDETGELAGEKKALQNIVVQAVAEAVQIHSDPSEALEVARQALEAQVVSNTSRAVDARCGASRFKLAADNIVAGKSEENPISDELRRRAAASEMAADSFDAQAGVFKEALAELARYRYKGRQANVGWGAEGLHKVYTRRTF
jgi:curved DNA-binding protein CbpA